MSQGHNFVEAMVGKGVLSISGGTGRDADVVLCRMVSGVDTGLIMQGGCREQYRAGDNIIKHWL